MILSLSTNSLSHYGLHRVFKFAKLAGYDAVDIEANNIFDTQDPNYILEIAESTGIPLHAYVVPPQISKKESLMEYILRAKKMGAKIVILYPPKFFDFEHAQWVKNQLPEIRKQEDIKIAIMNAPASRVFGILPEHALNSLNDMKKCKEVCLDTSNAYTLKEDLISMYSKLQPEIVHIFFSNVHKSKPYSFPTEGILPLESLISKLKKDDYTGALSVRIRGKELKEGDENSVIEHLQQIKTFVEKYYQ